ncbi:hypothetical protein CIHG_06442 [Coccidioides immitis H538.4]|uniref:Uncharacterized protein n=3 Tax=Coccidioides immitis TaxID=5501 RepID=A0A0J8QXE2_COCIT|nr:hypothetical protein CIRG_10255 [Coccidioides immitis RMSCC 2394]KMU76700.1 hypothetical protein CISG_05843 [Coccidioides immitis RMSCC 3703]KMU88773.1 hypothetical protein CIHG_06442 [Coccidioides immitis H538.4]
MSLRKSNQEFEILGEQGGRLLSTIMYNRQSALLSLPRRSQGAIANGTVADASGSIGDGFYFALWAGRNFPCQAIPAAPLWLRGHICARVPEGGTLQARSTELCNMCSDGTNDAAANETEKLGSILTDSARSTIGRLARVLAERKSGGNVTVKIFAASH